MSVGTTRLNLTKPGGGSTGLITPPDPVDIDVINANMDAIDAAIGVPSYMSVTRPASPFDGQVIYETDTKRISIYRQTIAAWVSEGTARGQATLWVTTDLTTIDAISEAIVGDRAFMTTPGTGIDSLWWTAHAGAGAGVDWRVDDLVVADTKAHLDDFVTAVAAIADTRFQIGKLATVTGTGIIYRFTSAVGAYTGTDAEVDLIPTTVVSVGAAPVDSSGKIAFSGITTGGTLRVNCDKATLALFSRIHLIVDMETGTAGQTTIYSLRLADGAAIDSTAGAYNSHGSLVSAGTASVLNATGTNWGLPAARRYWKGLRYEFSDLAIAHETTCTWKSSGYNIGQTNLITTIGGTLGHSVGTLAADGWEFTFTLTGGASASGTIRVVGEL